MAQVTNSTLGNFLTPSISGSGTRVVFRSFIPGNPSSGGLFVFDVLTGTVTQLDSDPGFPPNLFVDVDDTGTIIASASLANPTGENADGSLEMFVFDTTIGTVTQITHTTGERLATSTPSINSDGTRIAFSSAADLTGENPDGNVELFLFDMPTGNVTQMTRTPRGGSGFSAISDDGNQIAFESNGDLTDGNPDGNSEIFFIDARTSTVTQVTRTTGESNFGPSLSGDGTRIAFSSRGDLIGENPDGNFEIFLVDTRTAALIQVTRTTNASSGFPALSGDGTRIAFNSTADFTGENPDRNSEVFLFDGMTGAISQITRTVGTSPPGGPAGGSVWAHGISNSGTRIAFVSSQDLTGGNADRNQEIFLATCEPRDVTPPTLLVPTTIVVDATSPAGAAVTYSVSASDDVDTNPIVICTPPSGSVFPLRLTTVSCTATDASGNTAAGTFQVVVLDARQQLEETIELIASYDLRHLGTSLANKLQPASDFVAADDLIQACGVLTGFLNQVRAQEGKALTVEQATELTMRVTRIRNVIGC